MASELRIEPMTAVRLGDLDALFAAGDPRSCQCAYLRMSAAKFNAGGPREHRKHHHQAIRAVESEGRAAGLIAYDSSGPVGWVSFGPREEYAREHGVSRLEGYPVDTGGERRAGAELWHGTLSLFAAAGFRVVAERRHSAASAPRPIVRRTLRPPRAR